MPDEAPDPEAAHPIISNTTVSGGVNLEPGGDVSISGDVVGGDQITNVGYTAVEVRELLETAITAARDQAPIAAAPTFDELDAHYKTVVKAFSDGRVVPFLGKGANLCGRPVGALWQAQHDLPNDTELAEYLAESFSYPDPNRHDLLRVAQYIAVMNG